jgi:hypothetical protein
MKTDHFKEIPPVLLPVFRTHKKTGNARLPPEDNG